LDVLQKLELLGDDTRFEVDSAAQSACAGFVSAGSIAKKTSALERSISTVIRSDGKRMPVLKTLLSSYCARNCFYCPWRRGRDLPRVQFTPEEMAQAFMQMHARRLVDGLFLSSGIHGRSAWTMDRLIAVGELLRKQHQFTGYLHIKFMPGADRASVEELMKYADRVSINLEAPNPMRLQRLAPEKDLFNEILPALYWAHGVNGERRARGLKQRSMVTQFVVGATGESDREIVTTTDRLVREVNLSRPYFSAFHPVPNTPLDGLPPEDPRRAHRLYQVDFLLRQYQFSLDDIVFDANGNLPRHADPKVLYAQRHPELFPLEINRASREQLLRVPGIGPRSVQRILDLRRGSALREFGDLERGGLLTRRTAPFILLNGRRPTQQLALW
jgi:predicted DNA-binding helix-hairpin-helix protein